MLLSALHEAVIEHMPLVREAFVAGLQAEAPEMPVAREAVVSLECALWRAQRLAEQKASIVEGRGFPHLAR